MIGLLVALVWWALLFLAVGACAVLAVAIRDWS